MAEVSVKIARELGGDLSVVAKGLFQPLSIEVFSKSQRYVGLKVLESYLWEYAKDRMPHVFVIMSQDIQRTVLQEVCEELGRLLTTGQLTYDDKSGWSLTA